MGSSTHKCVAAEKGNLTMQDLDSLDDIYVCIQKMQMSKEIAKWFLKYDGSYDLA